MKSKIAAVVVLAIALMSLHAIALNCRPETWFHIIGGNDPKQSPAAYVRLSALRVVKAGDLLPSGVASRWKIQGTDP